MAISLSGLANFDSWTASFGLYASNAWNSADLEPDGIDNWSEYLFGGNPTNHDATAILPTVGIEGSWMEYVYRRRNDYQAQGLTYTVEATTNLVSNLWNTNGVVEIDFGSVNPEIDSVTNRVSTEERPEQFIRLRVW